MRNSHRKLLGTSLLASLGIAIAVTLFVTVWEWFENPGGIFRSDHGTNWGFVGETAVSWFLPTFAWAAILIVSARAVWQRFRQG